MSDHVGYEGLGGWLFGWCLKATVSSKMGILRRGNAGYIGTKNKGWMSTILAIRRKQIMLIALRTCYCIRHLFGRT